MLLIDAANVVGSRPTGWWRDRAPSPDTDIEFQRLAVGFAHSVLGGLALDEMVPTGIRPTADEIVGALKFIATMFTPALATAEEERS